MGGSMAINIAKKGNPITVFDLNFSSIDAVKAAAPQLKVNVAKSIEAIIEDNSIKTVITVLPESSHVIKVFGDNASKGLLSRKRDDLLFIDCTTGDIDVAKMIFDKVKKNGSCFVDAPISGGVMAAKDGTLTFMVGAETNEIFHRAKPILECMGKRVFHCGSIGTGLAAKICNNMLLAISMLGTCEAMSLGMKLGLDAKVLAEIINCSSGRCWSSEVYNPVPGVVEGIPSSKGYVGGFASILMAKDLGLAQNASTSAKSPIPLGSVAHQLYRLICQTEHAKRDFSAIFEFISKSAGKI
ncbi:hypothetical protein Ciccas_007892 [Cichlidogyrus casuarinus]|uniref:3-hydroxyisobutyrate dehydrogenase n=1 Tax=Cichlidogyrus casuarinus TaxID=1844966 RepID=A0ABD2Q2R2_9PLAT